MNAMYLVRPSSTEFDAWAALLDGLEDDGSDVSTSTYSWKNMFSAMLKSENFTAPLPDPERIANIHYDAGNYGNKGPMHVSYLAIQNPVTGNWTSTLQTLGIPEMTTPNGGNNLGGYITSSSINPTNWTRSYSRSAYIDPLPPRSNLHILPNALVTSIVFSAPRTIEGDAVATGVEYAESKEAPRKVTSANREVVLAGGPIGTPKILMLSGIGPRDVLESVGVAVVEELAGVGQHLQDHLTGSITWQANFETLGDIEASQSDFSHTPEFLSSINNAIAFLNLSTLFSHSRNDMLAMKTSVSNSLNASVAFVPSQYSEVKEGYKMIYKLNAEKFLPEEPQLEFLLNVINPGVVKVQAALQHPFSTGRVYINSSNPFDQAVVDPQYFSHPADITVLRQGIKLTRTLGAAFQSLNLFGAETSPGTSVETDEDWESWLRKKGARTEYHPSSSCVMLPRTLGGVVDKRMKVHGVANVRVVDSSVYPFEFAAHLGSATYGLAELGAQLIKEKPILVSASIDTSDAMTL